ncbi:MAG: sigma-54-dependent Fis family transcriptional regulator [candidate division NC10 bacterium]|nr:sigma-54-dependent Fis family transcriptional regulator [candidate division NC10 bacterium]MDE2320866.1 sigma-54-dependent Fis family transcriptional regulator [candidate division NC10 bacterium]
MNPSTLLIVDDERTLARSIKLFMTEQGYEAEVAENADKALELLDRLRPDLVFLDVCLPGQSGMELLSRIKEFDRNIAVIIMTAYGSIEGAVEAVKLGAFDYIKKPVDLDELKLLADRACESARLRQQLSYYREREVRELPLMGIIGKCDAIREIIARIRQIAALEEPPPILITGETGTGKGLVARTLHRHSRRAARSFIEVNCTALPATLMEAELFGYERGAFTDAKESKMGLFEAADGGFLYLDEVGDTELPLQGKLLRAVEERVIRRVGGLRDRRVDVTIVAATHRDLETEVKGGRFRKDLYYRLAVITIDLPPLRERGEDILLLATHFLETFNVKYGKTIRAIDDRAAHTLCEYPWPGNIRELSHVIERAVLWSYGDHLSIEQLSLTPAPPSTPVDPLPATGLTHGALPREGIDLAAWERSLVEQALRDSGGNQTKAAKLLRLSRDTLRYRLKKFGLSRP